MVGIPGFEPGTPWSQTRCATGLRYIPKYMYLVLTPTPLAMLSSCHQVTIGLQIISRLEWIHQVTTSTFVDRVGIEPTTLSLQGRNAKPWYMTAQIN